MQFKEYVSGQWVHRWRQVSKRKQDEKTFCDLNSTDSKNGKSINVNKHSEDSGNFTTYDVSRAENTNILSECFEKLCGCKENLLALRAQLLDANSILKKVWKANEMKFYDSSIKFQSIPT